MTKSLRKDDTFCENRSRSLADNVHPIPSVNAPRVYDIHAMLKRLPIDTPHRLILPLQHIHVVQAIVD